jgi:hypothetical protein
VPRPDRSFELPGSHRATWTLSLAAIALVAIVVAVMLRRPAPGPTPMVAATHDSLPATHDNARDFLLPHASGTPLHRIAVAHQPPPSAAVAVIDSPVVAAPPQTVTTVVDTPRRIRPLGPRYGDGRLWVEPLPESPRKIASILTGKSQKELTDSAVNSMVQTYLDEMATERPENTAALPSWTTKIAGKTVGLDQKWIYLGPLKIPTALIALLPIKMNANPTEWEMNNKLQAMRSDLMEAARRSANYEEFKESVKELHEQTERARQFRKNQMTPPPADTGHFE